MAICKAFGWSNYNLICSVIAELSVILLIILVCSGGIAWLRTKGAHAIPADD